MLKCEAISFLLRQAVNLIAQVYFLDYMAEVYIADAIQCLFFKFKPCLGLIHVQEGCREAEEKTSKF